MHRIIIISLIQQDGKRPDGTTLLPWARGKTMAWDVTVPDNYAESHIDQTAREACSAANEAAANKIVKYDTLSASHLFLPVTVESAGTWNQSAIELIQEIGRGMTAVKEDTRETVFLFQRLFIALQRGMRSPSWLHSTPCDTLSWSLFLLSRCGVPAP